MSQFKFHFALLRIKLKLRIPKIALIVTNQFTLKHILKCLIVNVIIVMKAVIKKLKKLLEIKILNVLSDVSDS